MAGKKKKEVYTYVKECADCGSEKIKSLHTYCAVDGSVRRRRKCMDCGYLFTTVELEECMSDVSGLLDDINELRAEVERLTQLTNEVSLSTELTQGDLTTNFVRNIKQICKERNMSIRSFEKATGVSFNYFLKCEKLKANIGIWTIYRASIVLGVPINRLLSKEG